MKETIAITVQTQVLKIITGDRPVFFSFNDKMVLIGFQATIP